MAIKTTTYVIEVDTKSGKIKIDGITKGFVKAELAAKRLNQTLVDTSKKLKDGTDKTGLAGAAVVELGRTISDSNYGITAMANNISQLSTLFVTLIATTGGLKNAITAMKAAFAGPLGIIVIFQIAVAIMERFAMKAKTAKGSVGGLTKELKEFNDETSKLLEINKLQLDIAKFQGDDLTELKKTRKEILLDQLDHLDNLQAEWLKGEEILKQKREEKSLVTTTTTLEKKWIIYQLTALMAAGKLTKDFFLKVNKPYLDWLDRITEKYGTVAEKTEEEGKAAKVLTDIERERLRLKKELAALNATPPTRGGNLDNAIAPTSGVTLEQLTTIGDQEFNVLALQHARRNMLEKQGWKYRSDLAEEELEHKLMMLDAIGLGLNSLGFIAGEATQEGKAIAAAGAIIDTWAAVTKTMSVYGGTPLGWAQSIAIGLAGLANVKKIYDVKVPGKSGGGGSVPSNVADGGNIQAPNFNIVGGSGINQLREAIVGELNKPNKVYITSKDVRTGAELDRNIVNGATVG